MMGWTSHADTSTAATSPAQIEATRKLEQVVHDEEHRHDYRDGKQQHPADREEI
jgi:hypothetical protein